MRSAGSATIVSSRRTRVRRGLVVYFVCSGTCLIWPLHGWLGNTIEPRVLGFPWSFAYVFAVVIANFGVLALAYHRHWVDDAPPSEPPSEHA